MKRAQMKNLQAYRRVIAWAVANPRLVPPALGDPAAWAPITGQCHALAGIVADIGEAAVEQRRRALGRTLGATDELGLHRHLRAELHVIAQVAQALRNDVPGIGTIRMPPHSIAAERLLVMADGMTAWAATYETILVDHGVAPGFIQQARDAIAALRNSIDARGMATAALRGATRRLALNMLVGRRHVTVMDATLTASLCDDPVKLAEWKAAKRVVATGTHHSPPVVPADDTTASPLPALTTAPSDARAA